MDWGPSLDSPRKDNFTIVRQVGSLPPEEVVVDKVVDLVDSKTAVTIYTNPTSPDTPFFGVGDKVTLTVRSRTAVNNGRKGLFRHQYSTGDSLG